MICALLTGAGGTMIRSAALSHNFVAQHLADNPDVEIIATLKSDPVWGAPKVAGSRLKSRSMTALVATESISIGGVRRNIRLPLRITTTRLIKLIPGEKFLATGTAFPSTEKRIAALVAIHGEIRSLAPANYLQRKSSAIRSAFRATSEQIGGDAGALIPGLVLGDTSLESAGFIAKMRRVGLTHLTAVSGENFAIIAAFILWLSAWVFKRNRPRLILTALILIGFIFLVRPSPSVMRASVMSSVVLIAKARGVKSDPLPSLGLAIALLILADPFQAIDPGFALSVAATAGILLVAPRISDLLISRGWNERLAELLAIPFSATIVCTPVIIAISGMLSLISIPANLLAVPVVGPITILGFIAALCSIPFAGISHLLLFIVTPFTKVIVAIANHGATFPVVLLPKSFLGAGIVLFVIVLGRYRKWKWLIALAMSCVLGLLITGSQWPGSNWEVVNCDVGQGDGLVINLGHHQGLVIDAGPDPKAIDNCLKDLGIESIPLLVLSHFHADHVMGLSGVLAHRTVKSVWITNYTEPKIEHDSVLAQLGQTPIHIVTQGEAITFDSSRGVVAIKVLWPRATVETFAAMPGDGSSINNSSIALDITVGTLRIFAGGDIEPPAQEALLASTDVRPVDILKVSHHGSAYQYLPLLDRLKPKVALISVGAGNTYGHPSPKTIAALDLRGIKTFRTDLDGALAIDPTLKIRTKRKDWWNISWG